MIFVALTEHLQVQIKYENHFSRLFRGVAFFHYFLDLRNLRPRNLLRGDSLNCGVESLENK